MPEFSFAAINRKTESDVDFVFRTRTHPEICKYLLNSPPDSLESHREWLKKNVPLCRWMFLLKVDGVPVGYCHAYDFIGKSTVEVGFVVHPDYHGRGYGNEMVTRLTEHLVKFMPDKKIILYVRMGNDRAKNLYEKNGYVSVEQTGDQVRYEFRGKI